MKFFAICSLGILFLCQCNKSQDTPKSRTLAQVGEVELTESEMLRAFNKKNIQELDSNQVLQFIDDWTFETIKLGKAKSALSENSIADLEIRIEDYRQDLIIQEYNRLIIEKHLPLEVSENELQSAYQRHSKNFRLKSDIFQAFYLRVPSKTPNQDELRRWMQGRSENYISELIAYQKRHKLKWHHLDEQSWLTEDALVQLFPEGELKKYRLRTGRFVKVVEGNQVHYLKILNVNVEQNAAPLEYIKEDLIRMIQQERTAQLLDSFDKKMILDARSAGKIELSY